MKQPYRLRSTIGPHRNVDPEDVWAIKNNLKLNGFYPEPEHGVTPYPDRQLFISIRKFQHARGLNVDGVVKPGGETERELLKQLYLTYLTRCRHCGVLHGGVYSPYVCYDCWGKGLR